MVHHKGDGDENFQFPPLTKSGRCRNNPARLPNGDTKPPQTTPGPIFGPILGRSSTFCAKWRRMRKPRAGRITPMLPRRRELARLLLAVSHTVQAL